jgi:rhodanese-related sulfurtransferase
MKWQFYLAAGLLVIAFLIYKQLRSRLGAEELLAVSGAIATGARMLDVRTSEEFSAGHVPNAVNIPVEQLLNRIKQVGKKKKPVVVYCRSGNRSGNAVAMLRGRGFTRVLDMKTMSNWRRVQAVASK